MKRILLAVCGLSPQVVTETLYALHQQGRMVDGIHVLTTREGREHCLAQLLDPGTGAYYRLLGDYGYEPSQIDFAARHVHAVSDEHGRQIGDIADENDNALFLQACIEQAFHLTRDRNTTVFFSLAGGRKTMSSCLAIAAQFYARPWDRLYHVLVSPTEFESSREFFYPPANPEHVHLRNREGHELFMSTDQARISLVSMPFVSLRERLADEMLQTPREPASLLMSLVREQEPRLVIDLAEGTISWRGVEADMPPARLALYAFFALRKKEADCSVEQCRDCRDCALGYDDLGSASLQRIARLHERVADRQLEEETRGIRQGLDREALTQYRSKINRDLRQAFGPQEAERLALQSLGRRNETKYFLALDRSLIRVVQ
jgi:CRISPR-associated protein Csx14